MATDYRLDVFDLNGDRQFVITDNLTLAYQIIVNDSDILSFQMSGDHSLLAEVQDKWEVEVWRRPSGQTWNRELVAMIRDLDWIFTSNDYAQFKCEGIVGKLGWRVVNYPTGINNRSAFTSDPVETIMKTLVDYNCGANATTGNGRKRTGTITGLSVEADGAHGSTENWYCHGKNVLGELQELALVGGGDFDLIKTGTNTWEFRWYTGQLGTDRSADVVFGMKYGNMGTPVYKELRRDEKTVACVWGQGTETERDYVTRTGDNYSASNDIEAYVDARDIDKGDTTALNSRGDAKMREQVATREFNFTMLQTPSTLYGVDYFVGDLVTAINPYNDDSYTLKINSVAVTMDEEGNETIEPSFTSVL